MKMKGVKIAILDSIDIIEGIINFYEPIFDKIFTKCEFEEFHNPNILLDYLKTKQVDIIITDLSLGDKNNFQGLNLVKTIKTNWPEILIIGNSEGEPTYRQTSSKYPTFDIYVDKGKLFSDDDDYIVYLKNELISKKFKKNTEIRIREDSVISDRFHGIEDYDLNSIIQQCTFTGLPNNDNVSLKFVSLRPLTGGRSNSDVYRFNASLNDDKVESILVVLKISELEKASRELRNYNKYVKWLLPYSWRVDVLGTGFTKKYGGICYSFILSGQEDFDSLTYYIENKNDKMLAFVYNSIFLVNKQKWYQINLKEDNLSQRYMKRYFWENCDTESRLFNHYSQTYFEGVYSPGKVVIKGEEFPLPYESLFGKPNKQQHNLCICHGDLNSNNKRVSKNNNIFFIDFQDTGFGHVFEDFIALESSIRLHYPIITNVPSDFLNLELNIEKEIEIKFDEGYKKHITRIRELAFQNFPFEAKANYYYGLAAYSFRLLRVLELTEIQKIRVTACLLSSLRMRMLIKLK